jgi:hypothetical protein
VCSTWVSYNVIWSWVAYLLPFLFHSRYISHHFVVDVIWRLPVWNVKIRCYLASCTLQFGSKLTKIIFQGKHFNYFIVVGGWRHVFWSERHYRNFKSPVFSLIFFVKNHWINWTLHIPNSGLDLRSQYTNYCYNLSP